MVRNAGESIFSSGNSRGIALERGMQLACLKDRVAGQCDRDLSDRGNKILGLIR